jgi:hypothetical protein
VLVQSRVQVQVNRIGDPGEADRCLDTMERASGLRGEPNPEGRRYAIEAKDVFAAHNQIIDQLPTGWQARLVFELA